MDEDGEVFVVDPNVRTLFTVSLFVHTITEIRR